MNIKDKFVQLFETTEMQEYMAEKFDELSSWHIASAVYGARAALLHKYQLLIELEKNYPEEDAYREYVETLQWAINNMKAQDGDIFVVLSYECIPGKSRWNREDFCAVFMDLDTAVDYIKIDYKEEFAESLQQDEIIEDLLCWYIVEKWSKNSLEQLEESICFDVMGNGEVIYFYGHPPKEMWVNREPNLPIPFKPGDIVTLDCRPYLPKRLGVILEIGDNRDCCSRQCLAINRKGRINTGALIHNSIFNDLNAGLVTSSLYRLERFRGEIEEKNNILKIVSNYIDGREESGREIWELFFRLSNRGKSSMSKKRLKGEILNKLLY